ncbi:hypothetical protein DCAR_0936022 [Daucus carota subsp. sativus]|uniref:Phorbol-ester/DAG-type domain-containing protein n=1 Tax=Daucus carota subsp. sativus TaxID=79200 RepID=A0AAF0XY54_DAUCS|nr:PREDICTED: uncharacterized protein LOC108200721 [Daucus carota subsp. sativus]XP_017224457.1 PREDICTED: uncharacterized protein LOC108200721 [Daucus carota subsp. sativus]WOH16468.1 hypothetical protein DCAR_0936022 [Daucus carota subsp. sativus]
MEHPSHEHPLILNEKYIAKEGDACRGCGEQILSCKSFVYSCNSITGTDISGTDSDTDISVDDISCARFLLHKNCAELPPTFQNPNNPKELFLLMFYFTNRVLFSLSKYNMALKIQCDICDVQIPWRPKKFYYFNKNYDCCICIGCVVFQTQTPLEDPKSLHPSHNQHLLSLIQIPSSFKCYACKVDDHIRDMSYKCTRCQFWIHKSCADAPMSFNSQFHDKHPLVLSFSLPLLYHKFGQFCGVCSKKLSRLAWIYYCRYCRFFAHFQCARSNHLVSPCEKESDDDNVLQFPVADELSANLIYEKFVKAMIIQISSNVNSNLISESVINHWTHKEHHLQLINSTGELKLQQDDDGKLLLCDGCVLPIGNDQFYGCVSCKYFLHKSCAELPKEINHLLLGSIIADKRREPYKLFRCTACHNMCNGIFFNIFTFPRHIGCMAMPKMIKHEAHRHMLKHDQLGYGPFKSCKACGRFFSVGRVIATHQCEECEYHICGSCIMRPRVAKHPWDIHPLRLIYEPGMVDDHEHDFNCEFCSEDIDTNGWFYHCSDCDLSFHLQCFDRSSYRDYSRVKFGATDIIIDKLHPHSLTFVLNKKSRSCERCHRNQLGEPVLQCSSPCKSIFCTDCIQDDSSDRD